MENKVTPCSSCIYMYKSAYDYSTNFCTHPNLVKQVTDTWEWENGKPIYRWLTIEEARRGKCGKNATYFSIKPLSKPRGGYFYSWK